MPTYEYSCEKCGKNFDVYQSMRDEPFRECPQQQCRLPEWGHGKVKRLLGTGAGIIFKGSGFYITDYRSSSYQEAAKKDAPPSTTSDKPAATKESGGGTPPAAAKPANPAETKSKKPAKE
jgi:putative FmdB family regulatory protein